MKSPSWLIITALILCSALAYAQKPVTYKLVSVPMSNGWRLSGTITTDGTLGPLAAKNFVDWNLQVVQTTDFTWTEKDSNNLNISGVSSDGKKIYVATSPDGIQDGGSLAFSKPGLGFNIPTSAIIADFTQLSMNLGYVGGMAGWQDELWGLNFVALNQRDNSQYAAASRVGMATALPGRAIFLVNVPTISTNPLVQTMFGSIVTDGTVGPLLPKNFLSWRITARNEDVRSYTKANSGVLSGVGITADAKYLKIANVVGQFTIGIGGPRPTFVTIADFTDPMYPGGFANYYVGTQGVMGDKSPLVSPNAPTYTFGSR